MSKEKFLADFLKSLNHPAVAFSGGLDSSFLVWFIREKMNKEVGIFHVVHPLFPSREKNEVERISDLFGWDVEVLYVNTLEEEAVRSNSRERCYYCKKKIMGSIKKLASSRGFDSVLDGTTKDDVSSFRPGMKALQEVGIISPFLVCGWGKSDIKEYARSYNLPFWSRFPESCLATRFPYGFSLELSLIHAIDEMELFMTGIFKGAIRARYHPLDNLLRIEMDDSFWKELLDEKKKRLILEKAKSLKFKRVTLDLEGFRSGSWDEV